MTPYAKGAYVQFVEYGKCFNDCELYKLGNAVVVRFNPNNMQHGSSQKREPTHKLYIGKAIYFGLEGVAVVSADPPDENNPEKSEETGWILQVFTPAVLDRSGKEECKCACSFPQGHIGRKCTHCGCLIASKFKVGDIVRYGHGISALVKLDSPHAGGFHATHCLGGTVFVSEGYRGIEAACANDIQAYNKYRAETDERNKKCTCRLPKENGRAQRCEKCGGIDYV